MFLRLLSGVLAAALTLPAATLIRGAYLVDGTGAEPRVADVLIDGERIQAVGESLPVPAGATVIDAKGKTLLPGLFDLHTHLPYAAVSRTDGDWGKNLKAYLYCGVTTVVDFGVYPEQYAPMRRLIRDGVIPGPHIHYAARIATPGGHGMELGRGDYFTRAVITPAAARAAVAELAEYSPDAIKVFTDGWRYGAAPDMTDINFDTLAVIVEEAHARAYEVLTHTVTLDGAKLAARAGVDVIAHGVGDAPADAELIALMTANHTTYAPTLAVYHPRGRNLLEPLLDALLPPDIQARIEPPLTPPPGPLAPLFQPYPADSRRAARWRDLAYNTGALYGGGVRVGLGTDAGVTRAYHGWSSLRELELLVETGLTPLQALTAGTGESAKAVHVDNERGTVRPGLLADLVLVDGKPFETIADMHSIERVFLGGKELDRPGLAAAIATHAPTPIPTRPAPALLDDMEGELRHSTLGTTWVNRTEPGLDTTRMLFTQTTRESGGKALLITAEMAATGKPYASADLPLSPGGIEPADVGASTGIRFDARGDGEYDLVLAARSVIDFGYAQATFTGSAAWKTIEIPLASFKHPGGEPLKTKNDLTRLEFEMRRGNGRTAWLELDNIRLY